MPEQHSEHGTVGHQGPLGTPAHRDLAWDLESLMGLVLLLEGGLEGGPSPGIAHPSGKELEGL